MTETHAASGNSQDGFWLAKVQAANSSSANFFDTNVRTRVIQDIHQFQGEHPDGSKYFTDAYRLKSKLFRPKTRAAIRKNEAIAAGAFFSTEDVVSLRPVDVDDPQQVAGAKLNQALLQLRLTRPYPQGIPWFLTCIGAYQEAQVVGVVASFQSWNYNEQKKIDRPEIMLLPVENVRFDPAADWRDVVNSSPYLIIEWPMYVKDVKARMQPEGAKQSKWRSYSEGEILAASKTSDTIRLAREGKGTDSKSSNTAASDYTIVWVHQNFLEVNGIDVMFYTLGTERMLTNPVRVTDEYPQGRPVVLGFSIIEAHKAYPSSVCTITRDVQGEINDIANKRMDNINLMLNKRYFASRGKNIDLRSLTRNLPGSVTLMENPNTDVKTITTDDATASSYQEQDRLNLDFDDVSGVFSGSSVASNRKLSDTVGGMQMLSSSANQVAEYQLRTYTETWVEPVLRQVLVLEQNHEADGRILAAAAKMAGVKPEDVTASMLLQEVMLNVNVGNAINPQMQLQRFAYAMEVLGKLLGPDFTKRPLSPTETEVAKEVFGKCGYKDGARFLVKADGEQDPQITELMQQIEALQQQLTMKNPPEVVAAQVAKLQAETVLKEVEAINKRVEALYSAMNTAETAARNPGIAPAADSVAKSAGFEDQDQAPIYPAGAGQPTPGPEDFPENTNPLTPPNPERGLMAGMEAGVDEAQVSYP